MVSIEIKKISDSLKMVRIGVINYFKVSDSILFDAGTSCTARKLIESGEAGEIEAVIVSHAHFDHITGIKELKKLEIEFFLHRDGEKILSKEKVVEIWNKEDDEFCRKSGLSHSSDLYIRPQPESRLKEVAETKNFEIIEIPGHSPDSIALFHPEERYILVADSLGFPLSDGNLPMYFYSFREYIRSIEKIKSLEPVKLCLGHDGVVTDISYCDTAIQSALKLKEEIENGLDEGEIFRKVYRESLTLYPLETLKGVVKLLIKRSLEK